MKLPQILAAFSFAAACCFAAPALAAGDGHDHGGTAPAAGGPALPRFAAVSETFELVGVLKGRQLTLYLDRAADNSPVRDAQIELDLAGIKLKAQPSGDAEYGVTLAEAPKPGLLSITATIVAGAETDLLAGELEVMDVGPIASAGPSRGWKPVAGWAAVALGALVLLVWGARRATTGRRGAAGGVA